VESRLLKISRGGFGAERQPSVARTPGRDLSLDISGLGRDLPREGRYLPSNEHAREGRAAMNISQAVAIADAADDAKLRRAYAAAIARGANNTLCTAEQEREYGTLRLLTLASLRQRRPGPERASAGGVRR
jgi:hypothetical protein